MSAILRLVLMYDDLSSAGHAIAAPAYTMVYHWYQLDPETGEMTSEGPSAAPADTPSRPRTPRKENA